MDLGLDGKVAIVTGGASGIGRVAAKMFVEGGARVLICDINRDRAEEAVQYCGAGSAAAAVADVGDEASTAQAVAAAVERWGKLDILCNNAGIMDHMQRVADTPVDVFDRVMRINATGIFLMTRAAVPHMLANKGGSIVNTASQAGLRGGAAGFAYTASKHAVVGMTRNVAAMYRADGIRCNAICPGPTATNIAESMGNVDPQGMAAIAAVGALMGNVAEASEMAKAIVFLASDAARNINGVILPVDSGWAAM